MRRVKPTELEQAKAKDRNQKKLKEDNQKAMIELEKSQAEKKKLKELWSRSKYGYFKIVSVAEDHLIARELQRSMETRPALTGDGIVSYWKYYYSNQVYCVFDAPVILAVDGKLFDGIFVRGDTHSYTNANGAMRTVPKLIYLSDKGTKSWTTIDRVEQKEDFIERDRMARKYQDKFPDQKEMENIREEANYSSFNIISITDNGVLASKSTREVKTEKKVLELFFVVNYPLDGVSDDQRIGGYFTTIGTHTYTSVTNARKTVKKLLYFGNSK